MRFGVMLQPVSPVKASMHRGCLAYSLVLREIVSGPGPQAMDRRERIRGLIGKRPDPTSLEKEG